MKTNWWPAFIGAGGALVAILLVLRLARNGCESALLHEASSGRVVFSCAEFWLNRYQGLLGNALTALVAGATLLWIAKQFEDSSRQTKIASAQALRQRLADLKEERTVYRKASKAISEAVAPINRLLLISIYGRIQSVDTATFKAIEVSRDVVPILYDSTIDSMTDARAMVYGFAMATRDAVYTMTNRIFEVTAIVSPTDSNEILHLAENDEKEIKHLLDGIAAQLMKLGSCCDTAAESTSADIERTWRQIRKFEDQALRNT